MKKLRGLVVLGSALFLFGCGGGGTTTTASNPGGSGGTTSSGPVGYITVNFGGGTTTTASAKSAVSASLPTATSARIVVRNFSDVYNPDTDSTSRVTTYKQVVDLTIPGTQTIAVPPGTGYAVDVITYVTSGSVNSMLKYGNATVAVISGQTASASITLAPINATITAPATIQAGDAYTVVANNASFPLGSALNLRVSPTAITDTLAYSSTLTSFNQTAPSLLVTDAPVTLNFQALFCINNELLNATETNTNWTYYYPNPAYGDPAVTSTVQPPGGVGIIIN